MFKHLKLQILRLKVTKWEKFTPNLCPSGWKFKYDDIRKKLKITDTASWFSKMVEKSYIRNNEVFHIEKITSILKQVWKCDKAEMLREGVHLHAKTSAQETAPVSPWSPETKIPASFHRNDQSHDPYGGSWHEQHDVSRTTRSFWALCGSHPNWWRCWNTRGWHRGSPVPVHIGRGRIISRLYQGGSIDTCILSL